MKFEIIKSVILNGTKWNQRISIGCLFLLAACTDYVQKIEDERDAWREEQALLSLSAEEQDISSSSKTTNKESSDSKGVLFSSMSDKSSSSAESDSTNVNSSSSTINEKSSSSEKIEVSSSSEGLSSSDVSSSSAVTSSSSGEIIITSSSSIAETSSSGKESWTYLNPAISYGEMIDDRDGQVYKTVVIGEQTWMAENLNFETESSSCYKHETNNCAKYGRYYTWSIALTACPNNWHLPKKAEWDTLFASVGGSSIAGVTLKSTTGWNENRNGSDSYGFTALPAGHNNANETYNAYFWSSSDYISDESRAYAVVLDHVDNAAILGFGSKSGIGFNVRCVRD